MAPSADTTIEAHLRSFFVGHRVTASRWQPGPAKDRLPQLRVLEIAPGPRSNLWTYVTLGASEANPDNPFEYLMIGDISRQRYVEILTMVAFYGIEHQLGHGHTIPIGEPLVDGS